MDATTSTSVVLSSPTAVVHLQYDVSDPPSKPGPEWTRFVCLSDTHCHTFAVPPGDVLLHSGDLTHVGTLSEFQGVIRWLQSLPHQYKIIIAGNHDVSLHDHDGWYDVNYHRWHHRGKQNTRRIREVLAVLVKLVSYTCRTNGMNSKSTHAAKPGRYTGFQYVALEFPFGQSKCMGMRIASIVQWSPYHRNWAFNYARGPQAEQLISNIPMTDVLLTHAPPSQILDIGRGGARAGCEALAARLSTLRPQLHVFGHIHEDHGAYVHECSTNADGVGADAGERTVFVNAANKPAGPKEVLSDGRRKPFGCGTYSPVIVDLWDSVTS